MTQTTVFFLAIMAAFFLYLLQSARLGLYLQSTLTRQAA